MEDNVEHIYIADTNLFFECKRLEDISWSDLGVDPIVVVLTKPVIGEIDKHKGSGGRTRKRALEMSGRIRAMLKSGVLEEVICEEAPRVSIRLAPIVNPDPALALALDYNTNDDRIVGIVSAMSMEVKTGSVCFLTDDSVAASTAHSVGVPFQLIEEGWKRPPEQTTEAKRIEELERDLAALRAQEPSIVLENSTDEEIGTKVVRRVALPLGSEEIEALVDQLRVRHSLQTEYAMAESERWNDGTEVTYRPPASDEVDKYENEAYPGWLSKCRSILEGLHEGSVEMEPTLRLTWGMSNEGTRPAIQVRVTFKAEGNIRLCRRSADDEDGGEGAATNEEQARRASPQLPDPPNPPQAQRIVKRPKKASGRSDSAMGALNLPELRIGEWNRINSVEKQISDLNRAAKMFRRENELLRPALGRLTEPMGGGVTHSWDFPPLPEPILPFRHDSEEFYDDDWPPNRPVLVGALICDLYRHQNGEELFEIDVLFPAEGDVRGAVVCTVHAENLTEPVSLRIPVSRCIEEYSISKQAQALVDCCGNRE